MSDDKTIMQLVEKIYRNYAYTVGECVEDMLSNGRITTEDLKKDHSLKKFDWMSIEQQATSVEVKKLAEEKISG